MLIHNNQRSARNRFTGYSRALVCSGFILLGGCATQGINNSEWADKHVLSSESDQKEFASLFLNDDESYEAQGDRFAKKNETDKAIYAYLMALADDQDNADIYLKVGYLHQNAGNRHLAQVAFNEALQRDPLHTRSLEALGLMELNTRQYDAAAEYLRSAIRADKQRLEQDAQQAGLEYDARSPYRAYNALGVILDLEGRYREAIAFYRTAAKIRPDKPAIANNIGYSFYLAEHWGEAEQHYQEALGIDEAYSKARRNLALLLVRQKEYNAALNILRSDFDNATALNTVGYLCMISGRYSDAERYFLNAIDASPSYYALAVQNLQRNRELRRTKLDSAQVP